MPDAAIMQAAPPKKRVAVFLDGTWNTVNDNTNVWRLIPDCGDTDSSAAPSALSMPPISHWTTVGFCNGCPDGAARSMSQGLRVLVLNPFSLPRATMDCVRWPTTTKVSGQASEAAPAAACWGTASMTRSSALTNG